MKTIKQTVLGVALIGFILSANILVLAEDNAPKLKSVGLAWTLGLDPLPGDALFYAGKPVQGTIDALLGIAGGVAIGYGVVLLGIRDEEPCHDGCMGPVANILGGITLGGGLAAFIPALLWDAVGGIGGVYDHNATIEKKTSFLKTFQPTFAVAPGGAFVGGQFRF